MKITFKTGKVIIESENNGTIETEATLGYGIAVILHEGGTNFKPQTITEKGRIVEFDHYLDK